MPNNTINAIIKLRNDSVANWTTNNPVLQQGEVGISFDPNPTANTYEVNFKIGDGTTAWNSLSYMIPDPQTLPVPDGTSIVEDNNTWSIAGYDEALADQFPVKNDQDEIEWTSLPTHFADIDTMYAAYSTLGTAAFKDVATSGDASTTQVVMGNDSRLTDARNAADVYDWAKAATKPTYTADETGAVATTANQSLTTTQQGNARDNIGLGTAAVLDVATTGDASTTQVVKGDDSRLTDARNAADVYDWAKAATKPTYTAAEVGALNVSTKYGADIAMSIDSSTYVVTVGLKDQDGNALGTAKTIDLPLESVVVGGSYDAETKKVILTLQSGDTVEFSVADLIDGLQSEITAQNPLDADLVDDSTSTNKFTTAADITKLAGVETGAQVNDIETISTADGALTITNKGVTVPTASASVVGLVKGSAAGDKVAVGNDGTMEVNSLSTDKLTQGTNTLIFDCGSSS